MIEQDVIQSSQPEVEARSEPSAAEVEQAMSHLAGIAAILDTRPQRSEQSGEMPPGLPGLVEMLPHLLAPLSHLEPKYDSTIDAGAAKMATYRPLVGHVQTVLSQLAIRLQDDTPSGIGSSVRLAEQICRQTQQTKASSQSKEAKREAILRARRKRFQMTEEAQGNSHSEQRSRGNPKQTGIFNASGIDTATAQPETLNER